MTSAVCRTRERRSRRLRGSACALFAIDSSIVQYWLWHFYLVIGVRFIFFLFVIFTTRFYNSGRNSLLEKQDSDLRLPLAIRTEKIRGTFRQHKTSFWKKNKYIRARTCTNLRLRTENIRIGIPPLRPTPAGNHSWNLAYSRML